MLLITFHIGFDFIFEVFEVNLKQIALLFSHWFKMERKTDIFVLNMSFSK